MIQARTGQKHPFTVYSTKCNTTYTPIGSTDNTEEVRAVKDNVMLYNVVQIFFVFMCDVCVVNHLRRIAGKFQQRSCGLMDKSPDF